MLKHHSLIATLAAALLLPLAISAAETEQQALLSALSEGGKVVIMRHASTQEAEAEVSMRLSSDCSEEQNLSAEGRAEARQIATAFAAHGITVDAVYSSEYCRARETAEIAFGGGEAWAALNLAERMERDRSAFLMMDVEERMGDFRGDGNLVLVTHRSNINTILFQQTEPSDMVILQPDGSGGVDLLGLLPVAELSQ